MNITIYTVYDRNDNIVATGNAIQCARQMKRSLDCFYCTVSRAIKGKNRKYYVVKTKEEV